MRIKIIGFSSRGCALAEKISSSLGEDNCSCFAKTTGDEHGATHVDSVEKWVSASFKDSDALIFISAVGIAVRYIAPHLKNKTVDPAVIVIDEMGKNIIPILSGHIGGANELSERISEHIGGNLVITTATDLNNVFAADIFAIKNDLQINNVHMVKHISAGLLEGKPVKIKSDFEIEGELPKGLTYADEGELGIFISSSDSPDPFKKTLRLTPKNMTIGIGCRRDIEIRTIEERVINDLKNNHISIHSLRAGGSIDLKRNERGLLEFFYKHKIPVTFFTKNELESVKGDFTESDHVKKVTGVGNVCERSALALSHGGELIVRKTSGNGVTTAVAYERPKIRFEEYR